jgi:hypothetical protein
MTSGRSLDAIRPCLEGAVPATVATCGADGTPNVTLVSQVHYVDASHVALSFQFFYKTRETILVNPQVPVFLLHPQTGARYRLALLYRRTETAGPLFESMKAKLAGIASNAGMSEVFRLRGADVYQVLDVEHVPGVEVPPVQCAPCHIARLRQLSQRLAGCSDLASLLEQCLEGLASQFEIPQAMVLLLDSPGQKLYTVASHGYPLSGVARSFPWDAASSAWRRSSARRSASPIWPRTTPTAGLFMSIWPRPGLVTGWRPRSLFPGWPNRIASCRCRSSRPGACSACCMSKAPRRTVSAMTRKTA